MNPFFNFGSSAFTNYVEVQSKVNHELVENSRAIQKLLTKKDATMDDWTNLQTELLKSSEKVTALFQELSQKLSTDSQQLINVGLNETKDVYKTLVEKSTSAFKVLQEQYINFYNEAASNFRNQQKS